VRSSALVLALALLCGAPARADIYVYTDDDGVTHYSNTPPSQRRGVRRIRTRARAPAPSRPERPRSRRESGSRAQRAARYAPFIREAAALYQLPEAFLRAVIRVESNFQPEVVSHAGACGLMQLMPRTGAAMGVTDPFDPRQNILGGARYLRILANAFEGDLVLTIAAYNAGEGAVVRYQGIPPYEETQRYVQRVLRHYYAYLSEG
jgi:soluble lytic murein transglycosylase-like protein